MAAPRGLSNIMFDISRSSLRASDGGGTGRRAGTGRCGRGEDGDGKRHGASRRLVLNDNEFYLISLQLTSVGWPGANGFPLVGVSSGLECPPSRGMDRVSSFLKSSLPWIWWARLPRPHSRVIGGRRSSPRNGVRAYLSGSLSRGWDGFGCQNLTPGFLLNSLNIYAIHYYI